MTKTSRAYKWAANWCVESLVLCVSTMSETPSMNENTLRLVLKENERVDVEGPVTIIANRKADLVFKGSGKIGKRYREHEK